MVKEILRGAAPVKEANEGPSRDSSLEKLGKLKPAFKTDGIGVGQSIPMVVENPV